MPPKFIGCAPRKNNMEVPQRRWFSKVIYSTLLGFLFQSITKSCSGPGGVYTDIGISLSLQFPSDLKLLNQFRKLSIIDIIFIFVFAEVFTKSP